MIYIEQVKISSCVVSKRVKIFHLSVKRRLCKYIFQFIGNIHRNKI